MREFGLSVSEWNCSLKSSPCGGLPAFQIGTGFLTYSWKKKFASEVLEGSLSQTLNKRGLLQFTAKDKRGWGNNKS